MGALRQPFYEMDKVITDSLEHLKDHHNDTKSFVTLFTKEPNNSQWHYKMNELEALGEIPAPFQGNDSYFSMNTFKRTYRRIEYISELRALYCDIDFYNSPKYEGKNIHSGYVEQAVFQELQDNNIPIPNRTLYSGRGIVLIWYIEPSPIQALPRWQGIQDHIHDLLKPFGADIQAKDCSRVFRMAGTSNSKSGNTAILKKNHDTWIDMDDLAKELFTEKEKKKPKKQNKPGVKTRSNLVIFSPGQKFTLGTLALNRINDLKTLLELRGNDPYGKRELFCFLYRLFNTFYFSDKIATENTINFNTEFKHPLPNREALKATESAKRGYKLTHQWIIDKLEITEEEERQLKTIIRPGEKKRRNTESKRQTRRKAGVKPKEEYKAERENVIRGHMERIKAIQQEQPGISKTKIAEMLGISRQQLYNILKSVK